MVGESGLGLRMHGDIFKFLSCIQNVKFIIMVKGLSGFRVLCLMVAGALGLFTATVAVSYHVGAAHTDREVFCWLHRASLGELNAQEVAPPQFTTQE